MLSRVARSALTAVILLTAPISSFAGPTPTNLPPQPDPFLQGSWRAPVKVTNTDPANRSDCLEGELLSETGWAADDAVATVDALEATGQNYYASHLRELSPDASCSWAALEAIATEAERRSGIQIVGGFPEQSLVAPGAGVTTPDVATDLYRDAVGSLRGLAAAHSSIKALVIDDFQSMLHRPIKEDPAESLSRANVEWIYHSAHDASPDPELDFTPYMGATDAAVHIVPGHVLGVRGWPCDDSAGVECEGVHENHYKLFEDDVISMQSTFNRLPVPWSPRPTSPGLYRLSFLYYDYYDYAGIGDHFDEVPLELVVAVNGRRLPALNLHDTSSPSPQNYIRLFEGVVASGSELRSFGNTLSISIEANGRTVPRSGHKIALIWDLRLERVKVPGVATPEPVPLAPATYTVSRDESAHGASTSQMIAGSNEAFRIDHAVDGVLVKYTSYPAEVDLSVYTRFLQSTANHLGRRGKSLISVYWGNGQWNPDTVEPETTLRREMYERSRAHTDGVVVWRLENALHRPDRGIFTEREAPPYEQLAFFPRQTSGTPGWRQSWTFDVAPGIWLLDWSDNLSGCPECDDPKMLKRVLSIDSDGVEAVLWEADINDSPTSGLEELTASESVAQLVVEMAEIDSFGHSEFEMRFSLSDLHGTPLVPTSFLSDVDANTERIYAETVDFFCAGAPFAPCP